MVGAVSHMGKEAGIPLLNWHLGMGKEVGIPLLNWHLGIGMLAHTRDAAVLRVRALPCDQKDY